MERKKYLTPIIDVTYIFIEENIAASSPLNIYTGTNENGYENIPKETEWVAETNFPNNDFEL